MHPNYVAELAAVTAAPAGAPLTIRLASIGARIRVGGESRWAGQAGQVIERRRTRYRVRLDSGETLDVPFGIAVVVEAINH